jgi:hypothetical protein
MKVGQIVSFISLVYGASQLGQSGDLKSPLAELEEIVLTSHRNENKDWHKVYGSPIVTGPSKYLLKNLELMDDRPFILLWTSYEYRVQLSSRIVGS